MPIPLRSRSGYFCRAFSACSFLLSGLDSGVNSRPTYLKRSHRSMILGMRIYSTGCRRALQQVSGAESAILDF